MKWWPSLISSLAALALVAGCPAQSAGPPAQAQVARVIDGDTLVLQGGVTVRVLGIDAPEMEKAGQPAEFLAHKAKAALGDLTRGQTLHLEYDRQRYDHYGRLLAYLFLSDGTFINAELVRRGLARVYFHAPNERYRDRLLAAQREALEAQRGVWLQLLKQDEPYYLGNRNTLRLHRPACPLAAQMAPAHRVRLESKKDAYLQGYSPCRSCKP
jgi:micrococcal nuclease